MAILLFVIALVGWAAISHLWGRISAQEERLRRLEQGAPQAAAPVAAPAPAPVPSPVEQPPPAPVGAAERGSSEFQLSVLLGRVGVIMLLLGFLFVFWTAVEAGLIGPVVRIALGLVVGAAGLWLGVRLHARYPHWAPAITGGALALLYFTLSVARLPSYAVLPGWLAFLLMCVVTVVTGMLALRQRSQLLAGFALAGGFLTPVLTDNGGMHLLVLAAYLLVLAAAVLWIAARRPWSWMNAAGFVLTALYLWLEIIPGLELGWAAGCIVVFAILYAAVSALEARRPKTGGLGIVLAVANALSAYLLFAAHFDGLSLRQQGLITLAFALAYAAQALLARRWPDLALFRAASWLLALAFLTLAVPLLATGMPRLVTLAWGAMGLAVLWTGLHVRRTIARTAGLILLGMSLFRLVAFDSALLLASADGGRFLPVLNLRALEYLLLAAALVAGGLWYAAGRRRRIPGSESAEYGQVRAGLPLAAALIVLWWIFLELNAAFALREGGVTALGAFALEPGAEGALRQANQVAHTIAAALAAAVILAVGIARRLRALRLLALGIFAFVVGKVLFFDTAGLDALIRVLAFLVAGALLVIASYSYQRFRWLVEEDVSMAAPGRTG